MSGKHRGGRSHRLSIFRRTDILRRGCLLVWHTADGSPVPRFGQIWPEPTLRVSLIGRAVVAADRVSPATMTVAVPRYCPASGAITATPETTYDLELTQTARGRHPCLPGSGDPGAVAGAVAASRQVAALDRPPAPRPALGGRGRRVAEPSAAGRDFVDPRPFAVPSPLAAFPSRPPMVPSPALERATRAFFDLRPGVVILEEQREHVWARVLPLQIAAGGAGGGDSGFWLYPLDFLPPGSPAPARIYLDLEAVRGLARPNFAFEFLRASGLLPPDTGPSQFQSRPELREGAIADLERLDGAQLSRALGRYRGGFASGVPVTDDDLLGSIMRPDQPLIAADVPRAMPAPPRGWTCSAGPWRVELQPPAAAGAPAGAREAAAVGA